MNKNGTIRDKYLYFGLDSGASETFNNVDPAGDPANAVTLDTSNFDNPTPDGVDFIANGGLKVTVVAHANQSFGTAYFGGSPTAGVTVDITAACTFHPTSGLISFTPVATDAVNGFTLSSTASENDSIIVTQLKPYLANNAYVYNSRYLQGIHYQTATTTELHFQGKTGDVGATSDVDTITVTHGSQKHKEFMRELCDIIADDSKVNGMVIVRDDMQDINLTLQNESGISGVQQTATAS